MVNRAEVLSNRRFKSMFSGQTETSKANTAKKLRDSILGSQFRIQAGFGFLGFLLGRAVILGYLNPFSMAYLAVSMLQEVNVAVAGAGILLGIATVAQKEILLKYLFSALLFIVGYVCVHHIKSNKKVTVALTAAVSNLIAGYFVFYIKDYFLYDLMMIIIESVLIFILVFIYDRSVPALKSIRSRRVLSSEEVVSFSILFAFCFVGAEFTFYGLSVKNISVILLIMLFSYLGSAGNGTAVGLIMGIVQALSGGILPSAIGVYGLCGLMCGIMKNLGRWACPLGFILSNALMTFYINGSTEVLIKFYEILTASVLFLFLPQSLIKRFSGYKTVFAGEYSEDQAFNRRVKEHTMEKLGELSDVFKSLSETLKDSVPVNDYFSQNDAAQVIEQVAGKSCTGCGMYNNCWKRDFYKSYQYFFNLLAAVESGQELSKRNIPQSFKERCLKSDEIAYHIRHYFDLYRNSIKWKKKINESRLLVCEQLKGVSSVVSDLAVKINMDVDFDREMEEMIMVGLDTEAIPVKDVIVAKSGDRLDVDIRIEGCGGKRDCIKRVIPIVNRITGRQFVKREMACDIRQNSICSVKLKEAQRFQVATGIAKTNKSGMVSGDNCSFIELKDGKFLLALSDGMGTGPKAAVESSTTITLLEKFLYAGFDKDVAVKTINSMLLMKSSEESYSTIDMTVINQYNGEVEFVKVGAVSTFIKHEDGVQIIRAGSLPVGILSHIDMELVRKKLTDGDFVIMVTDGILDSNKEVVDKEKWLAGLIAEINTRNPQKMAEEITRHCLELNGGCAPDDMTVMVAKIWESM